MLGDETYAGSKSFFKLDEVVKTITGYKYMIPTHQGRGAEQVLFPQIVDNRKDIYFISNTHFDTTRAHVEMAGARVIDVFTDECMDTETYYPFKGNFDLIKLEEAIAEKGAGNIGAIIITITNNFLG